MSPRGFILAVVGCWLGLLACNTEASQRAGAAPPVESLVSLGTEQKNRASSLDAPRRRAPLAWDG